MLGFNELLLVSGATLTTRVIKAYCKGKHVGLNHPCSLSSSLEHIFIQCKNSSNDKTILEPGGDSGGPRSACPQSSSVDIPEVYKFDLLKQSCCQDFLYSGLKTPSTSFCFCLRAAQVFIKKNTSLGKSSLEEDENLQAKQPEETWSNLFQMILL